MHRGMAYAPHMRLENEIRAAHEKSGAIEAGKPELAWTRATVIFEFSRSVMRLARHYSQSYASTTAAGYGSTLSALEDATRRTARPDRSCSKAAHRSSCRSAWATVVRRRCDS